MVDRFHRRMTHLLALPAARRCLHLRLLAIVLPETDIHITLNVGDVLQNIVDHPLLNGPTEKIQLAHCRLIYRRLAADLEADALPATEGIEETLGIGLELAFVVEVHHELAVLLHIADVELLRIIGHEPVDETETDG